MRIFYETREQNVVFCLIFLLESFFAGNCPDVIQISSSETFDRSICVHSHPQTRATATHLPPYALALFLFWLFCSHVAIGDINTLRPPRNVKKMDSMLALILREGCQRNGICHCTCDVHGSVHVPCTFNPVPQILQQHPHISSNMLLNFQTWINQESFQ